MSTLTGSILDENSMTRPSTSSSESAVDHALSPVLNAMTLQRTITFSVFTFFPMLPIEIRLKIWKLAELGPRLIVFNHKLVGMQVHPQVKQPEPLLATSSESRHEAQKTYKLYKAEELTECHLRTETDIFYFPYYMGYHSDFCQRVVLATWHSLAASNMRDLKCLALDMYLWPWDSNRWDRNWTLLKFWHGFQQLELLIMVVPGEAKSATEANTPAERGQLDFPESDRKLAVHSWIPRRGSGARRAAMDRYRKWALEDFEKTSKLYPEWKVPRLEFKIIQRGVTILREIEEYVGSVVEPSVLSGTRDT